MLRDSESLPKVHFGLVSFFGFVLFFILYYMIIEPYFRQSMIIEALFMLSESIMPLNSSMKPVIYCWKIRHIHTHSNGFFETYFEALRNWMADSLC